MAEYPVQTFVAFSIALVALGVFLFFMVKVLGLTALGKAGMKFKKEIEQRTERFYLLQSIVEKRRSRQYYLVHKGTVHNQMNFAELNIAEVNKRLTRVFSEYVKEKKLSAEQEMQSSRYFQWMKDLAENNCKDEIRRSFWENHFSEKSGDVWKVYKDGQFEKIKELFYLYIDHMERLDFYLDYKTLKEKFQEHKVFFKSMVDVIYDGARDIAIKYKEEIKCLEDMNKETYRQYLAGEELSDNSDFSYCVD